MTTTLSNARLSFGGTLRSELLKLTTVRGIWWASIASIVLGAMMVGTSSHTLPEAGTEAEWTLATAASAMITPWVIFGIYAALQATGEWSSGQFRVSFAIVPRHPLWLAAKSVAVGLLAAAVGLVVLLLCLGILLLRYGGEGATLDWGAASTWQVLVGVPVVFLATMVLCVSIGALVRSSGVAVTAVVGLLILLPFAGLLGLEWLGHIASYLPTGAADSIVGSGAFGATSDDLGPVVGSIVLLVWAVGAFVAASVAMARRDA
jgi:ABC-2 type transport system permease protein